MRRTTIILLIALAVVLAGAGVFFWLNQAQVTGLFNRPSANTNVAANLNRPVVTGTTPTVAEGSVKLDASLTVDGTIVKVTSWLKTKTFESIEAEAGKTFAVIYFEPLASTSVLTVKNSLATDAHLASGTMTYSLAGLKVASDQVTNDRGYLKFVVPEKAGDLQLVVGSGPTAQRVQLP